MIIFTPTRLQQPQQQQEQQPSTEEFINAQLQRLRNRAAPPKLEPGTRVQNINPTISGPENFQNYYRRLATIRQINEEQTARAQAEATLAQIRSQQTLTQPGGGGGGGAAVPSNPRENFKFAQNIAGNYGWSNPQELSAWYELGMKESGWRNTAQNPTSTAYGIGQFLDSTWRGYGISKTSDPALQVEAMARYIKARYGSPSAALAFHRRKNWY